MTRRAAALLALLLVGTAGAADYSKTLWSYLTGQGVPQPLLDSKMQGDLVMRMWSEPRGLPAEGVFTLYLPRLSVHHWMVMVANPRVGADQLVGARQVKFLRVVESTKTPGEKMNLFLLGDGTFKGLYLMEGVSRGRDGQRIHMVALLTPQMVKADLLPGDALRK